MMQSVYFYLLFFMVLIGSGCTDPVPEVPHVLELRAIPQSITISEKYFYPKPFSIRAKYSDKSEENINSRVSWLSENMSLITINDKGELKKNGNCFQQQCVVTLIATDAESGKSIRLSVKMKQQKSINQKQDSTSRPKVSANLKQNSELENSNNLQDTPDFTQTDIQEKLSNKKPIGQGVISNLQFSPQVAVANRIKRNEIGAQSKNTSSVNDFDITQLVFNEDRKILTSGDSHLIKVSAIDFNDQVQAIHNIAYECFLLDPSNVNLALLPGCQVIGVKPGEAQIGLRLGANFRYIDHDAVLTLQVEPALLNSSQQTIVLAQDNYQVWYQLPHQFNFSHYQATLLGVLSQNLKLSVFTRAGFDYPNCVNTLPSQSNSVACYFVTTEVAALIMVEKFLATVVEAKLSISAADEALFQYQYLQLYNKPYQLHLDKIESAFIFANEIGVNNKHFYYFENKVATNKAIFVSIFGYSGDLKLSVKWPGGFCNQSMIVIDDKTTSCLVHASRNSGRIEMQIDGNNGEFGVLNGSVANSGGTFYKLQVRYAE